MLTCFPLWENLYHYRSIGSIPRLLVHSYYLCIIIIVIIIIIIIVIIIVVIIVINILFLVNFDQATLVNIISGSPL